MAEAEAPEVEEEEENAPNARLLVRRHGWQPLPTWLPYLWPSLFLFFPLLNLMFQNLNKFLARCEMPSGYKKLCLLLNSRREQRSSR